MNEANGVRLNLTCDCGHKFEVPIAGKDLETLEIDCPACGDTSRLNADQIAAIVAAHENAVEQVQDMIADAVKGIKGITYRRK